MKSRKTYWLIIINLLILLTYSQELDTRYVQAVVERESGEKSVPGAAVGVIKGDELIYSAGIGYADEEDSTNERIEAGTLFRLGSTTKMFVAAAALVLVDKGKLDLTKPIKNYIADLPPKLGSLTMHQILTHTAGLFDKVLYEGPSDDDALNRQIMSWTDEKVFLEPGKFFSYSNPGYWLAGFVIESITKLPFPDAMNELLFKKLGMTNSFFRLSDVQEYPLAEGHNKEYEVIMPVPNHAGTYPSGSMFSTVPDIARFLIPLMNDGVLKGKQVLPKELVQRMMTSYVEVLDKKGVSYGYGIAFEERHGKDYVFHNGSRSGYGSIFRIIPQDDFAVIILANRTGALMSETADMLTKKFVQLDYSKDDEKTSGSSNIQNGEDFIGDFICPEIAKIEFFMSGILHLKRDYHRAPVKKIGDDFYHDYIYPFTVTRNGYGKVDYIHMEYHTLKRIK